MRQLISIAPLAGAWLGLVGWLISRIATTKQRMNGLLLSLVGLYFLLFVASEIWGTSNPSGSYLPRNLLWFAVFVGMAIVFFVLIFCLAGSEESSKVRAAAEGASVGMAFLGLAVDTFERSAASPINWTEIVYEVCKARLFQ